MTTTRPPHANSVEKPVAARAWRRLFEPLGASRRAMRKGHDSPFTALRRRLVVTNVVVVAIVLAALCSIFYAYEVRSTQEQVDQQLVSDARHEVLKGLPEAVTPDAAESPYVAGSPSFFSIVLAPPHQIVQDDDQVGKIGLPDWTSAAPVLAGAQPTASATVERGGFRYRLYTMPIRSGTHVVGAVQAGTSLAFYDVHLHSLLVILVLLSICVLLLTTILSAYLAARALNPARQAFARQRQFAVAASHELRTPLAYIRSQAELIAGADGAPQAGVAQDAREILTEVDYLTRMTRDLLLLARDEHDERALNRKLVDLRAVMRAAAATALPLAEARGVRLLAQGEGWAGDEALWVWGDADRLRQLILILLDNGIRYTHAGGAVHLEARAEHRMRLSAQQQVYANVTVRDTGVGIAATELPHIFEPFYRSNTARAQARDDGGTGLGLALAQWIARAHDGTITVQSTPGEGSAFTVMLPMRSAGADNASG